MMNYNKELHNGEAWTSADKWLSKRGYHGEGSLDSKWELLTSQKSMHKYFPFQSFIWRTKKYGKNLVVVCVESKLILTILRLDDWENENE
tara:strand:- start:103 stop:372 length:270 start_codon:yes stop_codon:yes gene_type:complete